VGLLAAATEIERERAWAVFVAAFTERILRVARHMGGDADRVMDRYAFVLDRLRDGEFRRLRAYVRPGAGEFDLWLVVVTRRLCLDHHRERYGRAARTADAAVGADVERAGRRRLVDLVGERADPTLLAGPGHLAPDETLARAERVRALEHALAGLNPSDRLLLRLRFAEELKAREIARLMQFPTVFHVYRRLETVLRELRSTLERLGIEGEM
jgi:RNA polymerase sigma factor (sigma-70 family)